MTFLLDTNVWVAHLRGRNVLLRSRVAARPVADLRVCSPVVGELYAGAFRSVSPAAGVAKVAQLLSPHVSLPFDDHAARKYAEVRAELERRGVLIGELDMMIAAVALVHGLTLVTHNTKDFARIPGLALDDWEVP